MMSMQVFPLKIDVFSLVMAFLVVFMTLSVSIYSRGYPMNLDRLRRRTFYAAQWFFCLFSCMGILSGDWLLFTIFLELSSLALFFMIMLQNPGAARLYLFTQLGGAGVLLAGVGFLQASTGSTVMNPVPANILWFFIIGLGVKAAFPLLHFWLPEVHCKAPTPASALLSGFAVKIGIFGLARLVSHDTGPVLLVIGPIMALYGVGQALVQHDAKRLLAYHTISQLGYIITAFGTGTPLGIAAGFFHAGAHALFKSLLFLTVGTLEKAYGTKDLTNLGGAARSFPLTFSLFIIGALAISGFPGFSGFAGKVMIKSALYDTQHPVCYLALQIAGIGTVISFCKMGFFAFLREPRNALNTDPDQMPGGRNDFLRNSGMLLPATGTVLLGVFPGSFARLFGIEGAAFFLKDLLMPALAIFAAGIILFWLLRKKLEPGTREIPDIDILLPRIKEWTEPLLNILPGISSGILRFYIGMVIAAGVGLFFILAF